MNEESADVGAYKDPHDLVRVDGFKMFVSVEMIGDTPEEDVVRYRCRKRDKYGTSLLPGFWDLPARKAQGYQQHRGMSILYVEEATMRLTDRTTNKYSTI